jgi:asparagine synthase (glutamine-hydrolysing)
MCGICGFLVGARKLNDAESRIRQMIAALAHRGPDDSGIWIESSAAVGLGHRRLAVIDLSPEGRQPMVSESGRYVITFNGEIYNFRELRAELEPSGHAFRGHSDTEVGLAAIEQWGLEGAIKRFIGMFALALWDRSEQQLHLARDRLGEKPLYYGWVSDTFLFGSELKALRAYPGWHAEVDRNALALYVRHNCIPAPHSIYKGIRKLLPGTVLTVKPDLAASNAAAPAPYWSAREAVENGTANEFAESTADAADQLEGLLRQVVLQKMVADVPLGAFLSGGVDSSTVVALMQAQSNRPVRTFTIGFHEAEYNEAEAAKAVAQHLGTDHTELYVTPAEAMDVIPSLPELYDEPFADSSQIPTYLVSKLTRQHVTVSLSGDGGDELFGGYNRYFLGRRLWNTVGWVPKGLRQLGAKALVSISPQHWNGAARRLPSLASRVTNPGDKAHKLAAIFGVESPEVMYHGLVSHWESPAAVVIGGTEPYTVLTDRSQWADLADFTERMMYLDLVTYLPDDILVKVDRASMAVSLEARVPLLDHRVVEFAWRLPLSLKIRNGQGKWLLRQVLYKYVPRELIERPKMGFGVPIDHWLRGPLRNWAEALLAEDRLKREGYFNPHPIRQKWLEHLSGRRNWQYHLWDILMFQAWLEAQ